jgi:O-antigen biosynthesis protein
MSRAIVVVGMHRSGTSAIARGLQALSVDLGDDLYGAHPENPTGYWEDRGIVELDERVLKTLGLKWDDVDPIDPRRFGGWRMWRLRRDAARHLRARFVAKSLWGFKDPRTIRLLPFWLRVLRESAVDDAYLVAIRNPMSVAASLRARQAMDLERAQRLWLAYMVPFLELLRTKRLVVVDYDRLMIDPRGQLERIARGLDLLRPATMESEPVRQFIGEFLDGSLRHTHFSPDDIAVGSDVGRVTRDAYILLDELAADRREPDAAFWSAWERIAATLP